MYKLRYQIEYLNRRLDTYYVNISEKDYTGNPKKLTAEKLPFKLSYNSGDDSVINTIRASECQCDFYSDSITDLNSFYSEDDEQFRIDFYVRILNGVTLNTLLWSGFLVQDDCQEDFQDSPIVCSLKGTDNLGLLKETAFDVAYENYPIKSLYSQFTANTSITFLQDISIDVPIIIVTMDVSPGDILNINGTDYIVATASFDGDFLQIQIVETFPANGTFADQLITIYKVDSLIGKISLFDIIKICIQNTGIALPVRIFSNIYENTTQDRGTLATATMFEQTVIFTGKWLNEDGTWANCYDILNDILFPLNATLIQAEGYWNIIRFAETYLFANNAIPGTLYDVDFANPTAITLSPNFALEHGTNNEFLNADAIRRIVRPFKYVKETFMYEQPKQLIYGSDLQTLGVFIGTSMVGDLRLDDYELPPQWVHKYGDTSFIRIVTDTVTNTEVERYVNQPKIGHDFKYVRFNPIEISANDSFDFSLQFKHVTNTTDNDRFTTRFILVTSDGQYYVLTRFPAVGSSVNVHWNGPFAIAVVDTATVVNMDYPGTSDDSQYQTFTLSQFVEDGGQLPVFPVDGMLLIDIGGTNETNLSLPDLDIIWKAIEITFTNRINDSTDIIGQTHTQTQSDNIKNNFDEDIEIDDSPRNTIAGTLFTNALTTFGADIGDVYFTKTFLWHYIQNPQELRLGEISTLERKRIASRARTIVEGTFFGINQVNKIISPLCVLQIISLPGLNFIMGICSFDFMDATFTATLWEIYADDDAKEYSYEFKYLYKVN